MPYKNYEDQKAQAQAWYHAKGGMTTFDNLQVLCNRCNAAKGNR